jgi:hypothetical protein
MSEEGGSPNLVICEIVLAHFSEDILDESGKIDQTKTDWVARLGGDWYVRASGDALFKVAKPNLQKGIGVDAIPDSIKNDGRFSGNDLGKLGNIEKLPTQEEIDDFTSLHADTDLKALAKDLLAKDQVREAWMALLSVS